MPEGTSGAPPLAEIPGYEVLAEQGERGMGVVWEARAEAD